MKKTNSNYSRAFTLVEMLVVIAIIAILAGILVPVIARSKLKAKVAVTRVQIKELENAIKMYKSDYSRFPAPKNCPKNAAGDFSVGGYDGLPQGNSDVMKILMADATGANEGHKRNPKKRVFINLNPHNEDESEASTRPLPGLGGSGIYRDPFGNQFNISMDLNGDGFCADSLYSRKNVVEDNWRLVGMGYKIVEGNYDALAAATKNKCVKGGRRKNASGVIGSYDYVSPASLGSVPDPLWYARKSEVMVWTAGPDRFASTTCPVFGDKGDKDYDDDSDDFSDWGADGKPKTGDEGEGNNIPDIGEPGVNADGHVYSDGIDNDEDGEIDENVDLVNDDNILGWN